ncbi:uncharacterized protein SCHCODRAFT_02171250 [Schizophyllum commune H4-8]|uniref:uncharacterized protein n=1 Tax=Schizophyllum commune (strain H4-8 / FGSC 9210) TaxID=578458 RepID=UPI00215F5DCC|nr:uncharacterized protein SCHCODRAFT_02171250 [Schizophyllum commune H4-8]KAI5898699.1 hypothetical protein SCHCODRAFT_02171250 [Schizophyllum commune H4-8]
MREPDRAGSNNPNDRTIHCNNIATTCRQWTLQQKPQVRCHKLRTGSGSRTPRLQLTQHIPLAFRSRLRLKESRGCSDEETSRGERIVCYCCYLCHMKSSLATVGTVTRLHKKRKVPPRREGRHRPSSPRQSPELTSERRRMRTAKRYLISRDIDCSLAVRHVYSLLDVMAILKAKGSSGDRNAYVAYQCAPSLYILYGSGGEGR